MVMSHVSDMMAYAGRKSHGLKKNRRGGIEGLPMELMIIIVIATMGTGILIGWMGDLGGPQTIGGGECSVNQINMSSDSYRTSFDITVTDSSGDGIKGATVVLTGCGITNSSRGTVFATTDESGIAHFNSIILNKSVRGVGYINVQVSSTDYGENSTLKIPVVR